VGTRSIRSHHGAAMAQTISYLLSGQGAERQFVEGLRRGEEGCYRQLYEVFAPRLQRTLERIFRDPNLAGDAVQATFLKVFRKIDQFSGQSSLLTWMTRIGIREGQDLQRRHARAGRRIEPIPTEPARTPEQQHAEQEMVHHLQRLIDELPIEKRTALLLFEVE